jgi:hypothetical protein
MSARMKMPPIKPSSRRVAPYTVSLVVWLQDVGGNVSSFLPRCTEDISKTGISKTRTLAENDHD